MIHIYHFYVYVSLFWLFVNCLLWMWIQLKGLIFVVTRNSTFQLSCCILINSHFFALLCSITLPRYNIHEVRIQTSTTLQVTVHIHIHHIHYTPVYKNLQIVLYQLYKCIQLCFKLWFKYHVRIYIYFVQ